MHQNSRRNRIIILKSAEPSTLMKVPGRLKPPREIWMEMLEEYPALTRQQVAVVLQHHREKLNGPNPGGVPGCRHTDMEIVWQVLKRAREIGVQKAATEGGWPRKTVQRWRTRFGIDAAPPQQVKAA